MNIISKILYSAIVFLAANNYILGKLFHVSGVLWLSLIPYIWIHIMPAFSYGRYRSKKLTSCKKGCDILEIFLISVNLSLAFFLFGALGKLGLPSFSEDWRLWLMHVAIVILIEATLFWNGIVRICLSSSDLDMKWRMIGLLCGMIPVVNLVVLPKLLILVEQEIARENQKIIVDEVEKEQQNM